MERFLSWKDRVQVSPVSGTGLGEPQVAILLLQPLDECWWRHDVWAPKGLCEISFQWLCDDIAVVKHSIYAWLTSRLLLPEVWSPGQHLGVCASWGSSGPSTDFLDQDLQFNKVPWVIHRHTKVWEALNYEEGGNLWPVSQIQPTACFVS